MDKKVSNKMKIIMRENGTLATCAFYEVAAAINLGVSCYSGNISLSSIIFNVFTLLTVGSNYVKALSALERDDYRKEHKEEYEELKNLYTEYIDEIVSMIKQYKFEDELQLCVLLDCLLYNGIFSYNNCYKYKHFDDVNEYFLDILGSFVITGNAVCRHTTSFMIDILSKLDINCYEIICSSESNKPNHSVVGITSNNKKFSYDFTNHHFGVIRNNYIYSLPEEEVKYKIFGTTISFSDFKKIPSYELDDEYINKYYDNLDKYDNNLIINFGLFSHINNDVKKEISDKTLKLMPRK